MCFNTGPGQYCPMEKFRRTGFKMAAMAFNIIIVVGLMVKFGVPEKLMESIRKRKCLDCRESVESERV